MLILVVNDECNNMAIEFEISAYLTQFVRKYLFIHLFNLFYIFCKNRFVGISNIKDISLFRFRIPVETLHNETICLKAFRHSLVQVTYFIKSVHISRDGFLLSISYFRYFIGLKIRILQR